MGTGPWPSAAHHWAGGQVPGPAAEGTAAQSPLAGAHRPRWRRPALASLANGVSKIARDIATNFCVRCSRRSAAQLVVSDPTALAALDAERVQSASANGAFANLPDAQWSDALPKLVQVMILRSLEDAGRFSGVSRSMEGLAADFRLVFDVRGFQLATNGAADVEFGCKIVASNGQIFAMRVFRASVAAEAANASAAVAALDQAFGQAGSDLVAWGGRAVNEPTPKAALLGRTSGG